MTQKWIMKQVICSQRGFKGTLLIKYRADWVRLFTLVDARYANFAKDLIWFRFFSYPNNPPPPTHTHTQFLDFKIHLSIIQNVNYNSCSVNVHFSVISYSNSGIDFGSDVRLF